jgi:hypothetical protein
MANGIFGCSEILGLDEFVPASAVPDGGTGGSGGQGGAECSVPEDCPGPDSTFCGSRTCDAGRCSVTLMPDGSPVPSQLYGDCQESVCDGKGSIVSSVDPADFYNDGNDCTTDTCVNGTVSHMPKLAGTTCMQGVCPIMGGICVQCLSNSHCPIMGDTCQAGKCVPMHCTNTVKDGNETDVDCGGPECNKCGLGQLCLTSDPDCESRACSGTPKKCVAPSCQDTRKNGQETAEDCGGPSCAKCAPTLACLLHSDCDSGVCKDNICQAPSCTDATQNGGETGVDCGGPTCDPC